MSWFLKNHFWKDTSQNNCPGAQNSLAITFHLLTKEISYKKYEEKKKKRKGDSKESRTNLKQGLDQGSSFPIVFINNSTISFSLSFYLNSLLNKSALKQPLFNGFKKIKLRIDIYKSNNNNRTHTFPCIDEQIVDANWIPAPIPTTLKRVEMASPFANRSLRLPSLANEE